MPTPSGETAAGLDTTLNDQFVPSWKKHNEWTDDEDKILIKAQGRLGNSWAEISPNIFRAGAGETCALIALERRENIG